MRALSGFFFVVSLPVLGLACGNSVVQYANVGASSGGGETAGSTSSATSTGSSSSTASSSSSSGTFKEAAFPAPPQVQDFGGPVLANPTIYGIFFAGDDASITGPLADFTSKIGATPYWAAVTAEYGVGPATAKIITLTETPATSLQDSDVQAWLTAKFGTDPNFPAAPSANDVYVIYYPSGVTITLEGNTSCRVFGGYHNSTSSSVAYAVVPRCEFQGATVLETTTGSASHEMIEAVTDPDPMSTPAFALTDFADIFWVSAVGGGEVGDMCAQNPQAFTTFPGFPYVVQRIWSNKAASEGHDPCQPEPEGEVYYNAAPVMPQMVPFVLQNQTANVRGIQIAVGKSATVPVDYYSEGPMAAWPVQAYDYQQIFMGQQPLLTFTLDPPTGENGTKGTLTINVSSAGANNQEMFLLASSTDGGKTVNWSFGVVTN